MSRNANAPNGSKSDAKRHAMVLKQRRALELRITGHTFQEIAEAVGWKSRQMAYTAVKNAMLEIVREPAEQLRDIELQRLERAERLLWQRIDAGDIRAFSLLRQNSERRSRLLGLDAPTKLANPDGSNIAPITINVIRGPQP